jgi:hypothetical protein
LRDISLKLLAALSAIVSASILQFTQLSLHNTVQVEVFVLSPSNL